MKSNTPKVIYLSPFFKLPEDAREVIFIKPLNFSPNKNLEISIEKCAVGYSFYTGTILIIYIKDLHHIILNVPAQSFVYSKGVASVTFVENVFYNSGRREYRVFNNTNWQASFPEKYSDETSINAGRDLYLLKSTDYRSLTPPVFEKIFNNVLKYCEIMEFYEICSDLMKFSADWFIFYEKQFEKQPLLKVTKGWGWLYFLNNRTKSDNMIGETELVDA